MSVICDLIEKVNDTDLRARLSEEVARMQKQKKFGLVFEEHLPEPLCFMIGLGNGILDKMLLDRTIGENIIWAADDYAALS